MTAVFFSEDSGPIDWSEAELARSDYGVKGASCLALPRAWTLPFALVPTDVVAATSREKPLSSIIDANDLRRIEAMAGSAQELIVRSSVVGESIWDRGTYESVRIAVGSPEFAQDLDKAVDRVTASALGKPTGLMIQRFIKSASQGEFGNLQRISKTRDQWEISSTDRSGFMTHSRLNSQRDPAASPNSPIAARSGVSRERLFGSIAAWLNNELLRGKSRRLNCEWITDNRHFYLVQIDEEDDDRWGINPFQLRVPYCPRPSEANGQYLKIADSAAIIGWDKLIVLNELWEENSPHKPILFYFRVSDTPQASDAEGVKRLTSDFRELVGTSGIVVRTSVGAGKDKLPNLPRTECLTPEQAAIWCIDTAGTLAADHDIGELAFIAHRFVASRASAWAKADPTNPVLEIHSLWGLPDALQYCPYDIWEIHAPTLVVTDYTEYKSDILISREDGGWEHRRVKNELARNNSINSTEARDIAARSLAIANRLGRACHIMWFVGCTDQDDVAFNMPWYWTEAHDAERNIDRSSYNKIRVSDAESLKRFVEWEGSRNRQALELKPTNLDLMRDIGFINTVGSAAKAADVPVILAGSTLAHAYYQLRKIGCAVVTPTEKERSRIRRTANLGKLVRDKIPAKIAERREFEVTKQVPIGLLKGFLVSKLLEEALEVRSAAGSAQKREELADVYEVFRAMAKSEGFTVAEIETAAESKREKAGGFEQGLVLLQTGIAGSDRSAATDLDPAIGQVLANQVADDTVELPFSFFGFMEFDQPRSILFEPLGVRLDVSLRPDRIEIRIVRASEQLGLALDEPISTDPPD
ncbi:nucleoside triphosphate pyrophosphohydrolase [Methylopila musalis]|uniref:Nucleoside triphosphate pyrophosphohydrolase n=1 Tax=Methylopila musalis TaxID=1134781 RepID=A0ABW3Z3A5_9HYPH